MSLLFCLAYLGIFVEEVVGLNKAAVALVLAVSLWTIHSNGAGQPVRAAVVGGLACSGVALMLAVGTCCPCNTARVLSSWLQTP